MIDPLITQSKHQSEVTKITHADAPYCVLVVECTPPPVPYRYCTSTSTYDGAWLHAPRAPRTAGTTVYRHACGGTRQARRGRVALLDRPEAARGVAAAAAAGPTSCFCRQQYMSYRATSFRDSLRLSTRLPLDRRALRAHWLRADQRARRGADFASQRMDRPQPGDLSSSLARLKTRFQQGRRGRRRHDLAQPGHDLLLAATAGPTRRRA